MESTSYIAASRQASLRREMRIVANNLANMNTTGYKAEQLMQVEHVVRSKGGGNLIDARLHFTRDIASRINVQAGALDTTGAPLDVALPREGYFAVRTEDGEELYTRNGHFTLDPTGNLVSKDGHQVLGAGGTPINLGNAPSQIHITRDGSVSTDQGNVGQLRIVEFDDQQALERLSSTLFRSEDIPVEVAEPDVIQGALERSNVEPILEMSKMIEVQRTYDRVRGFIQREDERQKKMIEELSKTV